MLKRLLSFLLVLGTPWCAGALVLVDGPNDLILPAESLQGKPYVWGGIGPRGYDCSGLIYSIFRDFAPSIPRSSRELGKYGVELSRGDLNAGDLLFFATGSDPGEITHVGLYIGQNTMIHAASDGPHTGVILTDLEEKYWKSRLIAIRRVVFSPDTRVTLGLDGEIYRIRYARGTYEGPLKDGEPDGTGTFFMTSGDRYEGPLRLGQFEGRGTYLWKDGSRYTGGFHRGRFSGEGKITWAAGPTYVGSWKDDQMDGQGIYTWPSGAVYEGKFTAGYEAGGWFTSPQGRRVWAQSEDRALRFYTDESASVPIQSVGLLPPVPRAVLASNNFKASKDWDNYRGPAYPSDWER